MNLSKTKFNEALIDAYETTFSFELAENSQYEGFSLHMLIDFLIRNHNFAVYGFYPGFGDLLYNTIISDNRSNSEMWLVSVLLKI